MPQPRCAEGPAAELAGSGGTIARALRAAARGPRQIMKVLLHQLAPMTIRESEPQRRIILLREALVEVGVEAEFFRWYDSTQTGDVLHFFGRVPIGLVRLAHQKGMRVVFTDSLLRPRPCSWLQRRLQRVAIQVAQKILPCQIVSTFDWQS